MTFYEVLEQAITLLQRHGRVTYRALKRQFDLDDAFLEDLKEELIYGQQLAVDEDGRVLVWTGKSSMTPEPAPQPPQTGQPPGAQHPQTRRVAAPLPAGSHPEAERRQLTVMFCDLVDSTPLAAQLDPEDLREVVRAYQATCAEVVQRFAGHIAQLLGDGLLVYFGWPQAHEDDARRAVRTGLEILEAMGTLNTRLERERGVRLAVRMGIHTGLVVVGEMGGAGRQEQLALGETPNMAARLQGLAAPDTVLISAATYRLVQGHFTVDTLGLQALKGVTTPVSVYRVLQESEAESPLDVAATRGLTPLMGRDSEVALLRERWAQSRDGLGQVVLLRGEAGIGKSRLVAVLQEQARGEGAPRLVFRSSPYHTQSALYPAMVHVQRLLHWQRDDPREVVLDKLEQVLRAYSFPLEEAVPLMAALLSVSLPERYPPLRLTPQQQRQQTLDLLVTWLLAEAARQPILVVWEDLHWADPSTLELLRLVVDQATTARMLTLLTCRPEFHLPWTPPSHVTQLTLSRLSRLQIVQMIAQFVQGKTLPAEVIEQVIVKTDGVPLFVEELCKMILESGLLREEADRYVLTGPLPPVAIPATLHDALMARLDRLTTGRAVAQLGAVLGREFPYALLHAVAPVEEPTLQHGLAQLVEAEVLYQRGRPPQATYVFKHALIQEAAYQSLLKSTRQQYHQRIAQVLAVQFAEIADTQPELLAHHYTEAGLNEPAVRYWQRAGERAIQRSAHAEAISHLTKGLEVLHALPDTPERSRQELLLQTTLGPALMAVKGYAALEVEHAYARARVLCQHIGDTPQFFLVLRGLWWFYLLRAELQTARELGEQLLNLAQRAHDSALLLEAHYTLGNTLNFLGELAAAQAHLEQGIALYDRQQHRTHALLHGQDPGVFCHSYAAVTLWLLGYPDQALQRSHEALTLAEEVTHPLSLAFALFFATILHFFRREGSLVQTRAEAVITLAAEHGFAHWWALGMMLQGWARAMQGQSAEGIAQLRQGLADWQATGARGAGPYYLAMLAEACGQSEQTEEGLRVLAEALALVNAGGERRHEAELYRLKGELLLNAACRVQNAALTAAECFHQSLAIAHHQQAKSLELRAAMSLSRLWQQQGKQVAARQLLAPIYGWFTEGFDTADLQEARALLETLGGA
jgi:predicted ATPase/class 3 adenylate cyclase